MTDTDKQAALYAALARAVAETDGVAKRGRNEQGRGYMYAKAEDVIREAERVLSAEGIVVAPGKSQFFAAGQAEGKTGVRTIFVLIQEFVTTHRDGGEIRGEVVVGVGTNLDTGPPQAISSALTGAERDYYRCLLRMPRCDDDDPDHPKNTRTRAATQTADDPPPPAKPRVDVPTTRKANRVLAVVEACRTFDDLGSAREKWGAVLNDRSADDDCGYTDAEVAKIAAALSSANAGIAAAAKAEQERAK